jgi:multicomponent Na+:H+ antiporter subunit G
LNIITTVLVIAGLIFFTGGTLGIIRLPDFYSRLQAAGMLDTMGLLLTMGGIAVYTLHDFSVGAILTSLKIVMIVVFVYITSPTATHAIVDAGVRAGFAPWTQDERGREE